VARGNSVAMTSERPLHVARDGQRACGARSAILSGIATLRGGVTVNGQPRLIHLKGGSELGPKCGASDATSTTNWVRGASFPEVYVPAEVVGRAEVVCRKCQEEAIVNDTGSDDEVVPDDEETAVAALADMSDADLLAEIARRMGNEEALSEEERKKTTDHRN
jgi:glutaredoxin-related protein